MDLLVGQVHQMLLLGKTNDIFHVSTEDSKNIHNYTMELIDENKAYLPAELESADALLAACFSSPESSVVFAAATG